MNRIPRATGSVALSALALVLFTGCTNPFQPSTPPAPSQGALVEDFRTPEGLLSTIAAAVAAKGAEGAQAYGDAFSDSTSTDTRAYYAFPDPGVEQQWAAVPHPTVWGKDLEKRFYYYLIAVHATFTYSMAFAPDYSRTEVINADSAILHRYYAIQASTPGITRTIAVGYADLYLVKNNGRWSVYLWQDRIDPNVGLTPPTDNPEAYSMGWRRYDSQTGSS